MIYLYMFSVISVISQSLNIQRAERRGIYLKIFLERIIFL